MTETCRNCKHYKQARDGEGRRYAWGSCEAPLAAWVISEDLPQSRVMEDEFTADQCAAFEVNGG